MTTVDLLIIGAYFAYSAVQGLRHRALAGKNLEEYFLAGRTLPGWKAGISMAATQFAADTPLVVTGLIATAGLFGLWRLWIYAVAFLFLGFVLAPSWRRVAVLTDAELTEVRYGGRAAAVLRAVKAVYFGTVLNCMVLAMVLLGATRIAEPLLLWNQWLPRVLFDPMVSLVQRIGVPLAAGPSVLPVPPDIWVRSANNLLSLLAIVSVTAVYSAVGGLRSVVATDVVQFAIMMAGTAAYGWIVVEQAGGWSGLPERVRQLFASGSGGVLASAEQLLEFTPHREISLSVLAVLAVQWLAQMNADGTGYLAQRTMACRSDRDATCAAVCFTLVQILFRSLLWVPLGVALFVVYPPGPPPQSLGPFTAERELTYVRGMVELLPAGLRGLVVTAMLAALASTVDTHLNWGASYWSNDVYQRWICQGWRGREPSPRSLVWVARCSSVGVLVLSMVVMAHLTSIQEAWVRSLLLGAGMGGLLVLRWLWWRWNVYGELGGLLASALLLLPLQLWVADAALSFLLMFVGSTAAGIVICLATPAENTARLVDFYRRAEPPGFWAPIARLAGCKEDGLERLLRALAAVALSSASVFCLLVGLGSTLVGAPAPSWWPLAAASWRVGLCAVGLLLIPAWWHVGFRQGAGDEYEASQKA